MKKQVSNFDLSKFTFLNDNVLVKAIREKENVHGLVDLQQRDDKPEFGTVVAVGPGRILDSGELVPPGVKIGDVIFFGKYSTEETRSLSEDYYIIRAEDVKAVK